MSHAEKLDVILFLCFLSSILTGGLFAHFKLPLGFFGAVIVVIMIHIFGFLIFYSMEGYFLSPD